MDIRTIREENLQLLLTNYDSQRALADATGVPSAMISQFVTKRRQMGDKTARKIEASLGLSHGWFDVTHDPEGFVPCPLPEIPPDLSGYSLQNLLREVAQRLDSVDESARKATLSSVFNYLENPSSRQHMEVIFDFLLSP
ncbi:hypothetical protein CCP4SC76_2660009 [Gammaproteobacteria bacterium]